MPSSNAFIKFIPLSWNLKSSVWIHRSCTENVINQNHLLRKMICSNNQTRKTSKYLLSLQPNLYSCNVGMLNIEDPVKNLKKLHTECCVHIDSQSLNTTRQKRSEALKIPYLHTYKLKIQCDWCCGYVISDNFNSFFDVMQCVFNWYFYGLF